MNEPIGLNIAIQPDAKDATKGDFELTTRIDFPSAGYTLDYEMTESAADAWSWVYSGLFTLVLKDVKAPSEMAAMMMAPASAEITYEIVSSNGGNLIHGNSLKFEPKKEYLFVVKDLSNTASFSDETYVLKVSDKDVKLEGLPGLLMLPWKMVSGAVLAQLRVSVTPGIVPEFTIKPEDWPSATGKLEEIAKSLHS